MRLGQGVGRSFRVLPRTGEFDDAVGIGCAGSSRKQNLRSRTSILGADPEKERAATGCSPTQARYLIRRPGRFLSPREWCSRIRESQRSSSLDPGSSGMTVTFPRSLRVPKTAWSSRTIFSVASNKRQDYLSLER